MKNGRSRRHSHHHNSTPSVICLPPPKPPITVAKAPRQEPEVARAIPMPEAAEPHVLPASRQVRRQARRQEAKTLRRNITVPAVPASIETASAPEALAPLPRDRALTLGRRSALQAVGQWLRRLVTRPASTGPVATQVAVAQVKAMRAEIAAMQTTLDRMLEGLAARPQ